MKAAAIRYADLLENGCFITHYEQDEIAKLLRCLVMSEDNSRDELVAAVERKASAEHYLGIMRDAVEQATLREREACAKLCEARAHDWGSSALMDCATAIRARGEK